MKLKKYNELMEKLLTKEEIKEIERLAQEEVKKLNNGGSKYIYRPERYPDDEPLSIQIDPKDVRNIKPLMFIGLNDRLVEELQSVDTKENKPPRKGTTDVNQ